MSHEYVAANMTGEVCCMSQVVASKCEHDAACEAQRAVREKAQQGSVVAQLRELKLMHDGGDLDDDEYKAAKAKLLS